MTAPSYQRAFRRRQGDFRDTSPDVSEAARHPNDSKGMRHRHLLALGCEVENLMPVLRRDGGARAFFAARDIRWWKSDRSGDDCTYSSPTRNLASSQVSCVNFLLPLAGVEGALETLLRAFDPDVRRVEVLTYDGLASKVEFEWVGLGESLEGSTPTRGANVTSADALCVASASGARCVYLIEWKCCEEHTRVGGKGYGLSGDTRRRRYGSMCTAADSSFHGHVPMDELLWEPYYQLMRLLLLGDRMVRYHEFGVEDFRVVVVCPEDNTAFRNTVTSKALAARVSNGTPMVDAMRLALRRPDRLVLTSQEMLLTALRASPQAAALAEWSEYHRGRYGW